jgi:hypothetical protein
VGRVSAMVSLVFPSRFGAFAGKRNFAGRDKVAPNWRGPELGTRRVQHSKVNMTISPAFLAPDLVEAAIDGRLPDGMGVARLSDMPVEWSRQCEMLGLPPE